MRSLGEVTRVLGELEERLMTILWDAPPMAVREVVTRLGKRQLAYTTVMTTLDRLHKKGLLARHKEGNAFVYQPAMSHADYQRLVVSSALAPLLEQSAGATLAAFVDLAAEVDEQHLAQLEALIAQHRKRK